MSLSDKIGPPPWCVRRRTFEESAPCSGVPNRGMSRSGAPVVDSRGLLLGVSSAGPPRESPNACGVGQGAARATPFGPDQGPGGHNGRQRGLSVSEEPCSRASLTPWGHEAATWPASATGVVWQGVVVNVEKVSSGEPRNRACPNYP